jgi:hypothetical protein
MLPIKVRQRENNTITGGRLMGETRSSTAAERRINARSAELRNREHVASPHSESSVPAQDLALVVPIFK